MVVKLSIDGLKDILENQKFVGNVKRQHLKYMIGQIFLENINALMDLMIGKDFVEDAIGNLILIFGVEKKVAM